MLFRSDSLVFQFFTVQKASFCISPRLSLSLSLSLSLRLWQSTQRPAHSNGHEISRMHALLRHPACSSQQNTPIFIWRRWKSHLGFELSVNGVSASLNCCFITSVAPYFICKRSESWVYIMTWLWRKGPSSIYAWEIVAVLPWLKRQCLRPPCWFFFRLSVNHTWLGTSWFRIVIAIWHLQFSARFTLPLFRLFYFKTQLYSVTRMRTGGERRSAHVAGATEFKWACAWFVYFCGTGMLNLFTVKLRGLLKK